MGCGLCSSMLESQELAGSQIPDAALLYLRNVPKPMIPTDGKTSKASNQKEVCIGCSFPWTALKIVLSPVQFRLVIDKTSAAKMVCRVACCRI